MEMSATEEVRREEATYDGCDAFFSNDVEMRDVSNDVDDSCRSTAQGEPFLISNSKQDKPPEDQVKDLSIQGLESLLQEAISYKFPQDRQNKSKLFQALLTKVEESDSGEDKLFIQYRNKPKKTEGKKKRRKESGSSVSVAARGTGGGSLQDLAAAAPARRGARSRNNQSQGSSRDGDGGVAGRTREGGSCGNLSKGSFQTSAPSERKKRRRRDGGRQSNHSGSLENLTQACDDKNGTSSGSGKDGHGCRKARGSKNRRDCGGESLNRAGSLQDILKSIEEKPHSSLTGAKKKKKNLAKQDSCQESSKTVANVADESEAIDNQQEVCTKKPFKKSGSSSLMEMNATEEVRREEATYDGCDAFFSTDVEMRDVSNDVVDPFRSSGLREPYLICNSKQKAKCVVSTLSSSGESFGETDPLISGSSRIAEGSSSGTNNFLPNDSDDSPSSNGAVEPSERIHFEFLSNDSDDSQAKPNRDMDEKTKMRENQRRIEQRSEESSAAMLCEPSYGPSMVRTQPHIGVLGPDCPWSFPPAAFTGFGPSLSALNPSRHFSNVGQIQSSGNTAAVEKKKKRRQNGERNVKVTMRSEQIDGFKGDLEVDALLKFIEEGESKSLANGTAKSRGRPDKRKTGADVTNKQRGKRDHSMVNVNGKSMSSGSEASSDIGCRTPDSGAKDGDATPSDTGSVDGGGHLLKRSSSHGELRAEEVSKTENLRKQSTLDSGLGVKGNANTYHSDQTRLSVEDDKDSFKEDFYSVTTLASNDTAVPLTEDCEFQTVTKKQRKKPTSYPAQNNGQGYKRNQMQSYHTNYGNYQGQRQFNDRRQQMPVASPPSSTASKFDGWKANGTPSHVQQTVPVQQLSSGSSNTSDDTKGTQDTSPTPSGTSRRRRKGTNSSSGVGTSKTSTSMPSSDVSDDSSDVESVQSLPANTTSPRAAVTVKSHSSFASYADIAKSNSTKAASNVVIDFVTSPTPSEKVEEMEYPPLPATAPISPVKPVAVVHPPKPSTPPPSAATPTPPVEETKPVIMPSLKPKENVARKQKVAKVASLPAVSNPTDDRPPVIIVGADGKTETVDLSRPYGDFFFGVDINTILTGGSMPDDGIGSLGVENLAVGVNGQDVKEKSEEVDSSGTTTPTPSVSSEVDSEAFKPTDRFAAMFRPPADDDDALVQRGCNVNTARDYMLNEWLRLEKKMAEEEKKDPGQRTVKWYDV